MLEWTTQTSMRSKKVELRLQDDGNLVLYRYSDYNDENTTPWHIWSTSTLGNGAQK